MPEFFIDYLGKIKLNFKFPASLTTEICEQSSDSISAALCESYTTLQSQPSSQDHLISLVTYLLLLKEYSSCIQLYKVLKISNPILSYNISLASTYTGEYKLGLYLIQCADTKDPSYLLLEVYLNYLLSNDTKALELFSSYQNQYISHSRTQTILLKPKKNILSQSNPRKTPIPLKVPQNPHHQRIKTMDYTALSTSPSFIFPYLKHKKQAKTPVIFNTQSKIQRKASLFSHKTPGLNQLSIFTEPIFNSIDSKYSIVTEPLFKTTEPKYTLKKLPDPTKPESPADKDLKTLSKISLQKIKVHYLTSNKNLSQVFNLVKKLKFFQQYSEEISLKLLNCAVYQFFSAGQIIFKENEFADKFFVILQGSVSILQEYKGLNIYLNSRYDGDTIGEYALARGSIEKKEAKRSATCIAGESLYTLYISSESYNEIMNTYADNESSVISFLKTIQLFEHIPKIDLAHMANCLHPKHFFFENEILALGEKPKGLYVIASGRVKAIYKNKIIELPPGFYFGQRVIVSDPKPSTCQVISNAVDTTILIIEPYHMSLIYKPMREITLKLLSKSLQQDL